VSEVIDDTVIIHPSAKIAKGVSIGAWSVIGPNVEIGEDTKLSHHAIIIKNTKIGRGNSIDPFVCLGGDPQDIKYKGEETFLEIGDHNIMREYVSMHRGSVGARGITFVGNNNNFFAYSHVAHDCTVGNGVSFINNATLGGHVTIDDYAILGAFTAVHQFCRVGSYSFLTRMTGVTKDIPPYVLVTGIPGMPCGLNIVALKRHGFSKATIAALRRAFILIYRSGLRLKEVYEKLTEMAKEVPEIQLIIDSIDHGERGIARLNVENREPTIEDFEDLKVEV
jgi:UDP-N-acetylglucosamine acyltransferase